MKKNILSVAAMAFVCAFGMVSCGDKGSEEELQFAQWNLTANNPLHVEYIEHDPTASYPVSLDLVIENGEVKAVGSTALPTEEALSHNLPNNPCTSSASISDYGEVKGMLKIKEYPEESTFAGSQVAALEHGYVIKAQGSHNINAYNNPDLHDPSAVYMRVYFETEIDGGYSIRYEIPFIPEE